MVPPAQQTRGRRGGRLCRRDMMKQPTVPGIRNRKSEGGVGPGMLNWEKNAASPPSPRSHSTLCIPLCSSCHSLIASVLAVFSSHLVSLVQSRLHWRRTTCAGRYVECQGRAVPPMSDRHIKLNSRILDWPEKRDPAGLSAEKPGDAKGRRRGSPGEEPTGE